MQAIPAIKLRIAEHPQLGTTDRTLGKHVR